MQRKQLLHLARQWVRLDRRKGQLSPFISWHFSESEIAMLHTSNTLPDRGACNDTYCMTMFLRACQQNDMRAQAWIERRFRLAVLNWIRSHPCRDMICDCRHVEADYVARTFEYLWQTAQKIPPEYMKLPALLRYMQTCVNAVIVDALRSSAIEAAALQVAADSSRIEADSNEIWSRLQHMLPDPREQRLAYLLYSCGLKPGEIVCRFPQEFRNVEEINRLRCRILDRLQG